MFKDKDIRELGKIRDIDPDDESHAVVLELKEPIRVYWVTVDGETHQVSKAQFVAMQYLFMDPELN